MANSNEYIKLQGKEIFTVIYGSRLIACFYIDAKNRNPDDEEA
jgi:hypothetical protein